MGLEVYKALTSAPQILFHIARLSCFLWMFLQSSVLQKRLTNLDVLSNWSIHIRAHQLIFVKIFCTLQLSRLEKLFEYSKCHNIILQLTFNKRLTYDVCQNVSFSLKFNYWRGQLPSLAPGGKCLATPLRNPKSLSTVCLRWSTCWVFLKWKFYKSDKVK